MLADQRGLFRVVAKNISGVLQKFANCCPPGNAPKVGGLVGWWVPYDSKTKNETLTAPIDGTAPQGDATARLCKAEAKAARPCQKFVLSSVVSSCSSRIDSSSSLAYCT